MNRKKSRKRKIKKQKGGAIVPYQNEIEKHKTIIFNKNGKTKSKSKNFSNKIKNITNMAFNYGNIGRNLGIQINLNQLKNN
jgi:hypothetical protein